MRKRLPLIFKVLVAAMVVSFIGLATLYFHQAANWVYVSNDSDFPVEKAEIYAAGKLVWCGSIQPKATIDTWFFAEIDGDIVVKGVWNGQEINSGGWGYVTPNSGTTISLRLNKDGEFIAD